SSPHPELKGCQCISGWPHCLVGNVMKAPTESGTLSACLALLRLRGILAWRASTTGVYDPARKCFRSFRGLKGVSDILGVLEGGGRLAVEVKSATGRLTPDQQWFLDEVNRRGGPTPTSTTLLRAGIGGALRLHTAPRSRNGLATRAARCA